MNKTITQYVLNNYFLNHTIDPNSIEIGYGETEKKIRIVNNSDDFFNNVSNKLDENKPIWDSWNNVRIPFLFSENIVEEIISINEDQSVTIHYDLISCIFYFLSGWQELDKDKADQYGRFPFKNSLQYKLKFIELPVVNYYYSILSKAICLAYGLEKVEPNLRDKNFITFVSHDIDKCQSGWIQDAFSEVKRKNYFSAAGIITKRLFQKDHWFNFSRILEFEKKRGILSTFFFIPRKEFHPGVKQANADYRLNSKKFESVLTKIRKSDSEVGLHGSLGSGLDEIQMKEDVQSFPSRVVGNRYHFLMYRIDRMASILDHCSISYDNSVYFAEHVGFRHSTCTPFYLYDFSKNQMSKVIEIPLIIMDGTLQHSKYMGVPISEMLDACKKTIDEVHKFNGILSILWHNNYYSDYKYADWENILGGILDYAQSKNTTYMSGEKIMKELNRRKK